MISFHDEGGGAHAGTASCDTWPANKASEVMDKIEGLMTAHLMFTEQPDFENGANYLTELDDWKHGITLTMAIRLWEMLNREEKRGIQWTMVFLIMGRCRRAAEAPGTKHQALEKPQTPNTDDDE